MATTYDCDDVEDLEYLAKGSFGNVYKADLNGEPVAVKILQNRSNYDAMKEIKRMRCLSHPNVVELIGTVPPSNHYHDYCNCDWEDEKVTWLIMEYMPNGSLLDYMRSLEVGSGGGITAYQSIKFAHQIALGMNYLHRVANVVHMDLAARNILVGADQTVKIGDFGLCDEYSQSHYYHNMRSYPDKSGKPCPIRWMPPENLQGSFGMFSRKGDVWSYGVVLFEIWTRGKKCPFSQLNNDEVISTVKKGNNVLNYDRMHCRSWIRSLMQECFAYDKADRPNFRQICETIEEESEYSL